MATLGNNAVSGGSISDILTQIQKLQVSEQNLIKQLDTYTSATGYISSDPKINEYVTNINDMANARIALFKTISTNADILQTGVSQSRTDLVAQLTLLQVIEDQLNQAKLKIDQLQNRNDTKMRMVQINTYYGQRYEAQGKLMKKIILVCIPILVVFILKKKGLLPETIANYLVGTVVAIGGFIIMFNIWDIYTRSNMEFNEYEWKYESPEAKTPSIWQYNKDNFFNFDGLLKDLMRNLGVCVSDICCAPGLTFDKKKQQCILPTVSANTANSRAAVRAQGFTSGRGLKGTVVASYYNDDKDSQNGILPFSYDMAYAPYM